jgi:DNA helicase HerA-like ATPase
LSPEEVEEQFNNGIAHNYVFTYDNDKESIELLFSNIDDPGFTMESILNFILTSNDFDEMTWSQFKDTIRAYGDSKDKTKHSQQITVQSWRKFGRLINNAINNDIFQDGVSGTKELHHVQLSNNIADISAGDTFVVDMSKLNEQLQCLVFGDILKTVYAIKQGDHRLRSTSKEVPRRIIVFVDELNKYAPKESPKTSPILTDLLEITERGRHEGIILFAAEQFRSAVHDRIKGNCSTDVYGRTNAMEISKGDYRYLPDVFKNMLTRLDKGDLVIQHPVLKTPLRISFPYPSYQQGARKDD